MKSEKESQDSPMKRCKLYIRILGVAAIILLLNAQAADCFAAETKAPGQGAETLELNLGDGDIVITGDAASQNGGSLAHSGSISITGEGGAVTAQGYAGTITLKGARLRKALQVIDGSRVTVVLEGKNEIKSSRSTALEVAARASVTIEGSGKLAALAGGRGAGIGSGEQGQPARKSSSDQAVITIAGGTISAAGGAGGGAGIGSCGLNPGSGADRTEPEVHITGGNITATGGRGASGIGSGAGNGRMADLTISPNARVLAFADGTRFAIDTYDRDSGTWKTVRAPGILQGTFMDNGKYEGLTVSVYKDVIPDSGTDLFYGDKAGTAELPAGYRSFAMSLEPGQNYAVQADHEWFSVDVPGNEKNAVETSVHTAHFATGSESLSDNYWLYARGICAELIVPDNTPPEESFTTTTTTVTTITSTTITERGVGESAGAAGSAGFAPSAVRPAPIVPREQQTREQQTKTIEDSRVPLAPGEEHQPVMWAAILILLAGLVCAGGFLFVRRKRKQH